MAIDEKGRRCAKINQDFPVDIHCSEHHKLGTVIECQWHENFEILYFEKGEAIVYCNSQPVLVKPGELIIINSNDLHYCENLSPHLLYYVIEFDLSFINSNQIDLCQTKYMTPLVQNRILFRNQIDQNDELLENVRCLIKEYYLCEIGYELAVKAYIYHILVLLLRYYVKQTISETEKNWQRNTLHRLRPVLEFVEGHYQEKLFLGQLAGMVNMSVPYFCRLFKSLTGKPPGEYINHLRLNKAVALLRDSDLNVTEIAMSVGFNDSNYFSRFFKKYKHLSPSAVQKQLVVTDGKK
jgi:AraC-like DNA-binding protein